eukprot:2234726-Alexandrium_andersonii.AAC.1
MQPEANDPGSFAVKGSAGSDIERSWSVARRVLAWNNYGSEQPSGSNREESETSQDGAAAPA